MKRSDRRYRHLRDRVRIEQPLCPSCAAQGLTVAGAEVDHITPLQHGGDLMERANLQHLCADCHREKHQGGGQSTERERPGNRAGRSTCKQKHRSWRRRLREAWA